MEIERKFLVSDKGFITEATSCRQITQAYLVADGTRTVRIRISDDRAWITIKGKSNDSGLSRPEYEYEIPLKEANEMLQLCLPGYIQKKRYVIPYMGHIWEVDVFEGLHSGLILAEVELEDEKEDVPLPEWIGKEVTGDKRYYNSFIAGIQ